MADDLKDTTTTVAEVLKQADKNAGRAPADTKVQAPADAIDLQNRIDAADETPSAGLAKLVKHQKEKDKAADEALAKEVKVETKAADKK